MESSFACDFASGFARSGDERDTGRHDAARMRPPRAVAAARNAALLIESFVPQSARIVILDRPVTVGRRSRASAVGTRKSYYKRTAVGERRVGIGGALRASPASERGLQRLGLPFLACSGRIESHK